MSKQTIFILIAILVAVSIWSIIEKNWHILVTNICVISGVFIEEITTKMLLQENVNFILIRKIQKYFVPILYSIGAISLILYGFKKF
jgi:hypothetical protein